MILKLIMPFIFFSLISALRKYVQSGLSKYNIKQRKDENMILCQKCETYVHESIIYKKSGRKFCSKRCSNL